MTQAPLIPAKYSYSWALGVVERVCEKYTRGSYDVCEFLRITKRILANYVAKGDPLWPHLRDLIRWTNSFYENPRGRGFSLSREQMYSEFCEHLIRMRYERMIRRIDMLKNANIIKEQGSEGSCGLRRSRLTQLSFDFLEGEEHGTDEGVPAVSGECEEVCPEEQPDTGEAL